MSAPTDSEPPGVFTRKWAVVMIVCGLSVFFLLATLGDPGRGRAAAFSLAALMSAARANWSLRKQMWFWSVVGVMVVLHALLVVMVPWSDRSYPGYALLPVFVLDFGLAYYTFKLVDRALKRPKSDR